MVDLTTDLHTPLPCPAHELDRTLGLHMNNVEFRVRRLGHLQEHGDRRIPDETVVGRQGLRIGGGATVSRFPMGLLDRVHDRLVVRMDHEREPSRVDRLEHPKQVPVVVDPGPAGMRVVPTCVDNHVDLVGSYAGLCHGLDLVEFARDRVVVPVHDALGLVEVEQLVEDLTSLRHRVEIGHPEHGRHATRRCGLSTGADVLLVDVAGLSKMDVDVDHPWQHPLARSVDPLHVVVERHSPRRCDRDDLLAGDQEVRPLDTDAGDNLAILDDPVDPDTVNHHWLPP